jgi:hypothetical protein
VDYLDEDAQKPTASTETPPSPDAPTDLELATESATESATDSATGSATTSAAADLPAAGSNDPFLQELLPEDRNARRRVVTALLRAVLAERKIT